MANTSFDKLLKKARDTVATGNHDYAIEMYMQALTLDPNSIDARRELRAVARKRASEKGLGMKGKMLSVKAHATLKGVAVTKKPDAIMEAAEKFLAFKPDNTAALKTLGKAAYDSEKIDLDVAIYIFEDLLELATNDADALRYLGKSYYDVDEQKAIGYFERLLSVDNTDKEAHSAIRDLAARSTMKQGVEDSSKEDGKDSWKGMAKDLDGQRDLDILKTQIPKTAEEFANHIRLQTQLVEQEADNARHRVKLGDLFMGCRKYKEAEASFLKAAELDPANSTHKFKVGDAKLKQMEVLSQALARKLKAGDSSVKEDLIKAEKARIGFGIREYAERVAAHPTDLDLRFHYGEYLFRGGKCREATAEFQQAVRNPKRKSASIIRLADCFEKDGNLSLATTQLEKELADSDIVDETTIPLIFRLGDLLEKQGKTEEAQRHYLRIYEVDINYRDVADRVARTKS